MPIDVNGVAKLMQKLDASKAPGPDGIHVPVLKMFYAELAPLRTFVFQASINYLFLWTGNRQTLPHASLMKVIALCVTTIGQYPRHSFVFKLIVYSHLFTPLFCVMSNMVFAKQDPVKLGSH